jgi:hypothetical protein
MIHTYATAAMVMLPREPRVSIPLQQQRSINSPEGMCRMMRMSEACPQATIVTPSCASGTSPRSAASPLHCSLYQMNNDGITDGSRYGATCLHAQRSAGLDTHLHAVPLLPANHADVADV